MRSCRIIPVTTRIYSFRSNLPIEESRSQHPPSAASPTSPKSARHVQRRCRNQLRDLCPLLPQPGPRPGGQPCHHPTSAAQGRAGRGQHSHPTSLRRPRLRLTVGRTFFSSVLMSDVRRFTARAHRAERRLEQGCGRGADFRVGHAVEIEVLGVLDSV